ncbi:MAG: TolC family protein, partial [Desulfobulbaceae bacterium]|nr:TolC family protein [Desulfobulbaceae bacterium]
MTRPLSPCENTNRRLFAWRRLCPLCVALLLAAFFSPAAGAATEAPPRPEVWTVRNAVLFAVRNNPDSRMGKNRIEAAQAAIAMEKSSFSPRLDLNSRYEQTDNPMYSFGNILNQGTFTNAIDFNNPGRTDTLNMGVRLGYRFF